MSIYVCPSRTRPPPATFPGGGAADSSCAAQIPCWRARPKSHGSTETTSTTNANNSMNNDDNIYNNIMNNDINNNNHHHHDNSSKSMAPPIVWRCPRPWREQPPYGSLVVLRSSMLSLPQVHGPSTYTIICSGVELNYVWKCCQLFPAVVPYACYACVAAHDWR